MAEIETTPVKDQESQHPIADAWRQTLRGIVKAFVEGDFALTRGIASVSPVARAMQIACSDTSPTTAKR